ncbi:MAG: hypothetical protein Q8755_03525, partial [Candidatus Phytoplasma australasiaticum]|nr:hypothetical protein [Candidatus Phytoplasma australasiaticum]
DRLTTTSRKSPTRITTIAIDRTMGHTLETESVISVTFITMGDATRTDVKSVSELAMRQGIAERYGLNTTPGDDNQINRDKVYRTVTKTRTRTQETTKLVSSVETKGISRGTAHN